MATNGTCQDVADEALALKNRHGYTPGEAVWIALLADMLRGAGYAVAEHQGAMIAARPCSASLAK